MTPRRGPRDPPRSDFPLFCLSVWRSNRNNDGDNGNDDDNDNNNDNKNETNDNNDDDKNKNKNTNTNTNTNKNNNTLVTDYAERTLAWGCLQPGLLLRELIKQHSGLCS